MEKASTLTIDKKEKKERKILCGDVKCFLVLWGVKEFPGMFHCTAVWSSLELSIML